MTIRRPMLPKRMSGPSVGVAMLLLVAGIGVNQLRASGDASCRPVAAGTITESQEFTPYEGMLDHLPELPLNPTGASLLSVPFEARVPGEKLDNQPLVWVVVGGGATYQYFLGAPMTADMTTSMFLAAGGVQLEREPNDGEPFASVLLRELGTRAVKVDVGGHLGAVTWADPIVNGIRTHNVYWSDGGFNYTVTADRSAVAALNIARGVSCG
jgi:hypothetical protein